MESIRSSSYTGETSGTGFTGAVDNSILDSQDFLNLMITQMQNQDFTNPMDDSQMISTMSDFSNMQMMQEMASYSQTNFALSLVGREVTATRASSTSGYIDVITGVVDQMAMVDGEYYVFMGDERFTLDQVTSLGAVPQQEVPSIEDWTETLKEIVEDIIEAGKVQPETETETDTDNTTDGGEDSSEDETDTTEQTTP